jgi:hypothetical protein
MAFRDSRAIDAGGGVLGSHLMVPINTFVARFRELGRYTGERRDDFECAIQPGQFEEEERSNRQEAARYHCN